MEKKLILEKMSIILNDILGVETTEVIPSASFMNDLGCDSIALSEIILRFEDDFELRITDDEAGNIKTVGDAVDCIAVKLTARKKTAA